MLRRLGKRIEIMHCISAKDIEGRISRDFGLTYDDQTLKDMSDLRDMGLTVSVAVINRFIRAFMYMEKRLGKEKSRLDEQYLDTFIFILQECERLKLVPKGYFIKPNAGRKATPEELNKIYADIEKRKREYEEKQKRRPHN
jgi:hypothetical protein